MSEQLKARDVMARALFEADWPADKWENHFRKHPETKAVLWDQPMSAAGRYQMLADVALNTRPSVAAGQDVGGKMPNIMYVCDCCADHTPESCGHYDPDELRIAPDGRALCYNCYSEELPRDAADWDNAPRVTNLAATLSALRTKAGV